VNPPQALTKSGESPDFLSWRFAHLGSHETDPKDLR
jgi:hypothetical protein